MSRPLIQYGVGHLEDLFVRSKADSKVLKQLEEELKYRKVPRAVALLAEVQAAMNSATPTPPSAVAATRPSASAPEPAPTQSNASKPPPETFVAVPLGLAESRGVAPAIKVKDAAKAEKSPPQPEPAMSLEDAYNALKSMPGSTWESIEQARRQLVQQSCPGLLKSLTAERRAQVLAEAKRVNAAYETVRRGRRN